MSGQDGDERPPRGAEERGLWRLMLKLPAMRGQIQLLALQRESMRDLCAAYEEACAMLEQLRNKSGEGNRPLVREYDTICAEIETDIIQFCLEHRRTVPE